MLSKYFAIKDDQTGGSLKELLKKLPSYTLEEVSKHNKENDIWVTYSNKVYDITKFIEYHPGGKEKILEAAGKSIKPYWNKYPIHNENQVKDIFHIMEI